MIQDDRVRTRLPKDLVEREAFALDGGNVTEKQRANERLPIEHVFDPARRCVGVKAMLGEGGVEREKVG